MKPEYTDWIESYMEGDLSTEERREFEEALKKSLGLREAYALRMAVDDFQQAAAWIREMEQSPEWDTIDGEAERAVKAFFTSVYHVDLNKKTGIEKSGRRRRIGWISALAAAVVIPVGLFFILTSRPTVTPEQFAANVQTVTSLELTDPEMPRDIYREISAGIKQYELNDYSDAIGTFEGLSPWMQTYPEISLFRGLVLLEMGEQKLAIRAFRDCAEHRGPYRKYARWFSRIACLRLLDPDAAFLFFIERSDFFRTLPEEMQNLIKAVNLVNTGQWTAYREMVRAGAEGPVILERDDIIAAGVLLALFILSILALIDIARMDLHRKDWLPPVLVLFFIPGIGALTYFIFLRKHVKERIRNKT